MGVALGQVEDKFPYDIYFMSKKLSKDELNYIVTEKEFFAIIHSLTKFRNYFIGFPTFIHNGHGNIKYLMNKRDINSRIIRWLLLLQQFGLTIIDKLGKENVVVDLWSRITLPTENEEMVDDQLPNEHFFAILVFYP